MSQETGNGAIWFTLSLGIKIARIKLL